MLEVIPLAGAVAILALLVTVSPSTLSSFTWFLLFSFSSFFLFSVLSLRTCGAPPPFVTESETPEAGAESMTGKFSPFLGELFSNRRKQSPINKVTYHGGVGGVTDVPRDSVANSEIVNLNSFTKVTLHKAKEELPLED